MEETSLFSYSKQKNLYFPFFKNKQKTNKQTNKQKKTKDKTDIIFLYEKEGDLPLPRSKNHNPSNPKNYHDVAFLMLPELKKK